MQSNERKYDVQGKGGDYAPMSPLFCCVQPSMCMLQVDRPFASQP